MRIRYVIALAGFFLIAAFTVPQIEFVQLLTGKMQQFKKQAPQVKLFFIFNQDVYVPGDTAYFSARFLTEDLTPLAGRQIIRLQLVDQNGQIVFFQNVSIKDGVGANQVAIPSDLKAGIYQWVAFSDWMKNFNAQLYFRQDFMLVERNELVASKASNNPTVKFYAEGGNLISSVSNRVAVIATPGVSAFRIVESNGEQVALCNVNERGLGQFTFTPLADKQYYAESNFNGVTGKTQLPMSLREGVALQLFKEVMPAKLEVRIPSDSKLKNENLWMVITSRSEILFSAPLQFGDKEMLSVQFPQQELPPGICYATIFNERGEVMAERLFTNNSTQEINAEIRKEKSVFDTRELINLQVSVKNQLGNPVPGEYVVSVVNKRFKSNLVNQVPITHYLLIHSDLPAMPAAQTDADRDLLLMTQKNVRINWRSIWEEKFQMSNGFRRMIQYSGRVVNKENGQPVPDSTRVITYLQKNTMGYEATTDKNGNFDLSFLFDFWNEDDMFYMVENKRGKEIAGTVHWQLDTISDLRPSVFASESESINGYAEFQLRNQFISRSYKFYNEPDNKNDASALNPNRIFEDELSGADYSVKVDDYVVFPTMEELIREVVPSLQHRKSKGKSTVRVILPDGAIPPNDPLFMIDGIMTRDTDYFLQLKPSEVISIKIVRAYNKLTRMGALARNGIVLVVTKGTDHKNLLRTNTMLQVKGVNRPVPFREINHSDTQNARIPDFRSTLYWNPSVKVDSRGSSQLSFSASDDVGTFLIHIQGLTADGRPFEKQDSIVVKFNKN
jgi:hypothetical protein